MLHIQSPRLAVESAPLNRSQDGPAGPPRSTQIASGRQQQAQKRESRLGASLGCGLVFTLSWLGMPSGSGAGSLPETSATWAGEVPTATSHMPKHTDDDELVDLITQWLRGSDPDLRTLAFEQVRADVPGAAATEKFAGLLPELPTETQVGLLAALAERRDPAARPAVLALTQQSERAIVRVAGLRALGDLGTAEDLPLLIAGLSATDVIERAAAVSSLTRLPGADALVGLGREIQAQHDSATRVSLIEIAAQRRAVDLVPILAGLGRDVDLDVRKAALAAVGQLAGPSTVPDLIPAIVQVAAGPPREWAEKAIVAIYGRYPEMKEQPQHPLLHIFLGLSGDEQASLLPAVGRVGGTPARRVVDWYLKHPYPFVSDVGWRALCLWPDATVAADLLQALERPADAKRRSAAFKALVRVAGLANDTLPDEQRLEWLKTAMRQATSDDERQLVLRRVSAVRHIESLRFALSALDQPNLVEHACHAIVELAHLRWLRDENKAEFLAALDRVQALSRDPIVLDRAQRYKDGKTWTGPG